jgi:hypothetical protein
LKWGIAKETPELGASNLVWRVAVDMLLVVGVQGELFLRETVGLESDLEAMGGCWCFGESVIFAVVNRADQIESFTLCPFFVSEFDYLAM